MQEIKAGWHTIRFFSELSYHIITYR